MKIAKPLPSQSAPAAAPRSNTQAASTLSRSAPSPAGKDWFVTFLLAYFLGGLGIDRFYAGRTGLGLAKLFTCGICGLWALVDCILLLAGKYQDGTGNYLSAAKRGQWWGALVILVIGTVVGVVIQLQSVKSGWSIEGIEFEPPSQDF